MRVRNTKFNESTSINKRDIKVQKLAGGFILSNIEDKGRYSRVEYTNGVIKFAIILNSQDGNPELRVTAIPEINYDGDSFYSNLRVIFESDDDFLELANIACDRLEKFVNKYYKVLESRIKDNGYLSTLISAPSEISFNFINYVGKDWVSNGAWL